MTKDIFKIFILILLIFTFFYLVANPQNFLAFLLKPKSCYQENKNLSEENVLLKKELTDQNNLNSELNKLKEFCKIAEKKQRKYFLAEVVGLSPFNFQPYFIINAGSEEGLKEGMPVISPLVSNVKTEEKGIVLLGIISEVKKNRAKVSSLYDDNFSASVYSIGEGGEKNYGLVEGESDRIALSLISQKKKIAVGISILTSGLDQKFPAGLYVGKVKSIEKSHGIFKKIEVEPLFDWQNISKVLVVTNY